jgi:hypothetical protein
MALKKLIEFENGTIAEYHKISYISVVPHEEEIDDIKEIIIPKGYRITLILISFSNQLVREKDTELFIDSNEYQYEVIYDNFNSADLFAQAYNYLKTLPQFEGAEDV